MLYQIIDEVLFPMEITMLIDEAILICPAMRRNGTKIYPFNIKKLFPEQTEEFYILGAALMNDLAFN